MTYPVHMPEAAYERIINSVPEAAREGVLASTFPGMVSELAKPGDIIRDQLTLDSFTLLANACAAVIAVGDHLDLVKKKVIYNKPVEFNGGPAGQRVPADLTPAFSALTGEQAHLLHMAIGMAGEAAEMLSQVYSHVFTGAQLDVDNVVEESGDSMFYIQGLLGPLNVSLPEAIFSNQAKLLGKRYANGYSDKAAQERADKPAGE